MNRLKTRRVGCQRPDICYNFDHVSVHVTTRHGSNISLHQSECTTSQRLQCTISKKNLVEQTPISQRQNDEPCNSHRTQRSGKNNRSSGHTERKRGQMFAPRTTKPCKKLYITSYYSGSITYRKRAGDTTNITKSSERKNDILCSHQR